jgi:hypothetical protein
VVVTPTCGLAGASPEWVRTAYAFCEKAGRVLRGSGDEEWKESERERAASRHE